MTTGDLPPEANAAPIRGAYEWSAVYLAHMALGVALVAVIAAALSLCIWRQGAWAASDVFTHATATGRWF